MRKQWADHLKDSAGKAGRFSAGQSKMLLTVIDQKTRPVEAKLGELQGEVVQLVTYRPIALVSFDNQVRRFSYRVYGLNWHLLVADEWKRYSEVQEMIRMNKAFLPNGWPMSVRQFLLTGGIGESSMGTPRVLDWLARFYTLLSRTPGDYAYVERDKIRALIAKMKEQQ